MYFAHFLFPPEKLGLCSSTLWAVVSCLRFPAYCGTAAVSYLRHPDPVIDYIDHHGLQANAASRPSLSCVTTPPVVVVVYCDSWHDHPANNASPPRLRLASPRLLWPPWPATTTTVASTPYTPDGLGPGGSCTSWPASQTPTTSRGALSTRG